MLTKLRSRLTYANAMATVAVFVAFGGTSYAVATGSIDSREIKNNTVRSQDIRNHQVSTSDLRNNSASGRDIRNDTLTGDDILESALGEVPKANQASTANTATNSNQLGGVAASGYLQTGTRVRQASSQLVVDFASGATILSLHLPTGQWAVVAKLSVSDDDGGIDFQRCDLTVPGPNDDESEYGVGPDFPGGIDQVAISMVASTAGGEVTVSCTTDGDNNASDIRIVAMNLG